MYTHNTHLHYVYRHIQTICLYAHAHTHTYYRSGISFGELSHCQGELCVHSSSGKRDGRGAESWKCWDDAEKGVAGKAQVSQ